MIDWLVGWFKTLLQEHPGQEAVVKTQFQGQAYIKTFAPNIKDIVWHKKKYIC